MSKIDLRDLVTLTAEQAEQVKALVDEGEKCRKDFVAKWKRSQRSDDEILDDRIARLEALQRQSAERSDK